jgi:hypothetical protein
MKSFFAGLMMLMVAQAWAGDGLLSSLDADKDGTVSEAEASANADIAGQFKALDANQDGKLDQQELGGQ